MIRRIFAVALLSSFAIFVNAGTGFLNGEETSGLNKICYYDGVNGAFSKTVGVASLCPQSADDGRRFSSSPPSSRSGAPPQPSTMSNTGFLSGERSSGLNKTCFYDSPRGAFTKTVGAASLCPQSAKQ